MLRNKIALAISIVLLMGFIASLSSCSNRLDHVFTKGNVTNFQYSADIDFNDTWYNLRQTLIDAKEGDTVNIYLTSPGGLVFAGQDLIAAMEATKATVVIHVTSLAASMAGEILCFGDKTVVDDRALLLYHTIQGEHGPIVVPSNPVEAMLLKNAESFLDKCTFLTAAERQKIRDGQDIWLSGAEYNRRMEAMKNEQ